METSGERHGSKVRLCWLSLKKKNTKCFIDNERLCWIHVRVNILKSYYICHLQLNRYFRHLLVACKTLVVVALFQNQLLAPPPLVSEPRSSVNVYKQTAANFLPMLVLCYCTAGITHSQVRFIYFFCTTLCHFINNLIIYFLLW